VLSAGIQILLERVRDGSLPAFKKFQDAVHSNVSLPWLTHTSPYETWIRKGGTLWYKKPAILCDFPASHDVAIHVAAQCRIPNEPDMHILHFQCNPVAEAMSGNESSDRPRIKSTAAAEVLQSLIFQSLTLDGLDAVSFLAWINALESYDQQIIRKVVNRSKFTDLRPFIEALKLSITFTPEPTIVALDNVEKIESRHIHELLSGLRALATTGSIRLVLGGNPITMLHAVLEGVESIDNDTEYQGKISRNVTIRPPMVTMSKALWA
jgi:hypothetical protein